MARKTSLYIDDAAEAIVVERDVSPQTVRRHGRRSMLFRELLRRYDEIARRDLPRFTDDEWQPLLAAGRGWATSGDVSATGRLAILFSAAGTPKTERLLKKLLALTIGQRMALIDYVERYWAAKARGEVPPAHAGQRGAPTSTSLKGKHR